VWVLEIGSDKLGDKLVLQIFLGNMDIDSKPFWFRRKESILHRNMHTAHILHVAIGQSYMSPFWNHILGFLYVEIAKIAVTWKLAKKKYLGGDLNQGPKLCSQSSLSDIHPPTSSVSRHFFNIPNKDRIHMNSYAWKLRSPGIWIHVFNVWIHIWRRDVWGATVSLAAPHTSTQHIIIALTN